MLFQTLQGDILGFFYYEILNIVHIIYLALKSLYLASYKYKTSLL